MAICEKFKKANKAKKEILLILYILNCTAAWLEIRLEQTVAS